MAAKNGRPVKEINFSEFEKLCAIQCTLSEIAAWFCCSEDTIERRVNEEYGESFAEVFKQKKRFGKISLRRTLFHKAQEGNPTLLIWLSKQHLGMSDKNESNVTLAQASVDPLVPAVTPEAAQLELTSRMKKRVPQKP